MKVTPKLKKKSIVLSYRLDSILYELYVNITVESDRWSISKRIIKGEGSIVAEKNAKIKKYQKEIELYILRLRSEGREYVHNDLKEHLKKIEYNKSSIDSSTSFIAYFESYIAIGEDRYASQTIKAYNTTKNHFIAYIKKEGKRNVTFDSLTVSFLTSFNDYLNITVGLSPASRGKQIKNIKAVMKKALDENLHSNRDFQAVKKDKESSVNVFLKFSEIIEMIGFDKFTTDEQKVIDAFVFICLTGLRYKDYYNLESYNFYDVTVDDKEVWYLSFIQHKTREKVEVPIMYKEVVELLRKYNFELPKFTNAFLNRSLKEIFEKHALFSNKVQILKEKRKGIYLRRDLITIHTGRRSFCTNQYLQGTPSQFIMAASGHKTESAFRIYIKADSFDKANGLLKYINY